ncbi:MAG TPA: helix-turn-helix domain-containing protein [Gammaproteobacteria bacterium]|nr:helix-turn-helix domain-containing protein [Gammaproteobacteria bacterium]
MSASGPESNAQHRSTGVRALARGLRVLVAVNETAPATVSRVVKATGIPKATVIRLLGTLQEEGYLGQDGATQAYHPLVKVRRLASAMMVESPFLAEARRILNEFGQQVKWPGEILLAESDAMVIATTNRDTAPITLKQFEQRRFPMLDSASGAAYLAALPVDPRRRLVSRICSLDHVGTAQETADRALNAAARAQDRGYATRTYHAPMDGMQVFAVPLFAGSEPVGALVVVTLSAVMDETTFVARHLDQMKATARQAGQQYSIDPAA